MSKSAVTLRFSKCDNSFDRPFDKLRVTTAKIDKTMDSQKVIFHTINPANPLFMHYTENDALIFGCMPDFIYWERSFNCVLKDA